MSHVQKLKPGLPLELDVLEGVYKGKYRSQVEEMGEKILVIGAFYEQGEVVPLREGTKVKLTYWDELAAYSFEAVIMQRIAIPLPMFVLALPDSIARIQRRSYVRIPIAYPMTFRIVLEDGVSDKYEGVMLDLSGGGVRFRFKTQIFMEQDSLLEANIFLPDEILQASLRVIRVDESENNSEYIVSGEFFNISERQRDQIVRFVFKIQRELRKKGLIE